MPNIPIDKASLKCPHCRESFTDIWQEQNLGTDKFSSWWFRYVKCPACMNYIFFLRRSFMAQRGTRMERVDTLFMVWPKAPARLVPVEVPAELANDFREACLVMADSAKASAALSRRCLQRLLREEASVKSRDLANEIQQVLNAKSLPSYLAEALDTVRNIGNFAAHPIKSKRTGEIIDVEPGEAEWLLDTLEGLFDFYFVQPATFKKKKDALNKKLSRAGKPPMKK